MQASSIGGSAETEAKALTVTPKRPAGPSVVTSVTPVAASAIACKKDARASPKEFPCSIDESPHRTDAGAWSAERGHK